MHQPTEQNQLRPADSPLQPTAPRRTVQIILPEETLTVEEQLQQKEQQITELCRQLREAKDLIQRLQEHRPLLLTTAPRHAPISQHTLSTMGSRGSLYFAERLELVQRIMPSQPPLT